MSGASANVPTRRLGNITPLKGWDVCYTRESHEHSQEGFCNLTPEIQRTSSALHCPRVKDDNTTHERVGTTW